jgi:aspartate/methionine/tyrosine aminotransferase
MRQFPDSPITALIDEEPRYWLGESMGPDLTVAGLLGPDALAGLAGVRLRYGTSAGDPDLRARVAARLRIPDGQVLITTGAAAALFLVSLLIGDDGEILIGQPCYPPTRDALLGLGASVAVTRSRFDDGYRLDLGAFRDKLSPRTRLVIFASPQNPSGVALTEQEVEQMLEDIERTCPGAILLIDETFREAAYGGAPAPSLAGKCGRLLTCASLSKAYGTPGLRIGWLTTSDPGLYQQLRLAKFNSSLSCGAVDEFLAARLLARADQLLAARGAFMAEGRGTVERWVKSHAGRLRWVPPDAGALCCVQLDPGVFGPGDVGRFHARLARERTQVAPGPWFGDGAHVFRLGFGYEPAGRLQEGLGVIGAALDGVQA